MKASKEAIRAARKLMRLSVRDGELDLEAAQKMTKRIAEAKPRGYLGILTTFQRLLRLEVDKKHAVVESATTLDAAEGEGIAEDLRRKYGKNLTTEFKTNPDLIGGLRVRVGSDVWDGSVRARLQNLANKI
jgi:F-type H+-transporting ATPase subunit delta